MTLTLLNAYITFTHIKVIQSPYPQIMTFKQSAGHSSDQPWSSNKSPDHKVSVRQKGTYSACTSTQLMKTVWHREAAPALSRSHHICANTPYSSKTGGHLAYRKCGTTSLVWAYILLPYSIMTQGCQEYSRIERQNYLLTFTNSNTTSGTRHTMRRWMPLPVPF